MPSFFKVQNISLENFCMKESGSRCGSAVKGWNEKINEIKRSRVCSPARETFFLKKLFAWKKS
jgi:hypothetical protein